MLASGGRDIIIIELDYRTPCWKNKTTRLRFVYFFKSLLTYRNFFRRRPGFIVTQRVEHFRKSGYTSEVGNHDGGVVSAFGKLVAPPPSYVLLVLIQLRLHVSLLLQNMAGRAGREVGEVVEEKGVTEAACWRSWEMTRDG